MNEKFESDMEEYIEFLSWNDRAECDKALALLQEMYGKAEVEVWIIDMMKKNSEKIWNATK